MFGKLKEKLSGWAKKIKEKAEKEENEVVETEKEEIKEVKRKKESEKPKEIEPPMKFNVGSQKFEPDLDKIEEKIIEQEKIPLSEEEKIEKIKEELKENKKITVSPEKKSIFSKFSSKINKVKISEKEFEIYKEELEMLLLENNVAFDVTDKITKELQHRIVGKELLKKEVEFEIRDSLREIIEEILIEPFDIYEKIKESEKPFVILFCGINGSGKTTTVAKVAKAIKDKNLSCVIAAGDTFRAASIEQIKEHGNKIGVKVISGEYGADPASIGFDAIQYAKKNKIDAVLIDTAGRMHTSKNLMQEIEKIAKITNANLKIFVGESITGNDAIEQAKSFNFAIGVDGIILTKADIDDKGGTALSVGYITKKPILYLGIGQTYDNIEEFDKNKFIEKLGL